MAGKGWGMLCERCGREIDNWEPFKFFCDDCLEYDRLVDFYRNREKLELEIRRREELQQLAEWNRWARGG
jgi:NMD protein affecting ribosome stability and mRNA decay